MRYSGTDRIDTSKARVKSSSENAFVLLQVDAPGQALEMEVFAVAITVKVIHARAAVVV